MIDVAINRCHDGKLRGDVVFEEAAQKASFLTPVPGGVGPMTRVMQWSREGLTPRQIMQRLAE